MTSYTTITSDCEKWELSAKCDENGGHSDCFLSVPKNIEQEFIYFDKNYIFKELFLMVENMYSKGKKDNIVVTFNNAPIFQYLEYKKEETKNLYEVLLRGKRLSWDVL